MILPINEFTIDQLPDFTSTINQEEVKLEIYHSHYDELKELLKQGISISVYPHPCYQGEFTYETYQRLPDGTWSSFGSNAVFSSSHLFPRCSSPQEAWETALARSLAR